MPKLAGTLFVYNGKSMDYCYIEAVKSLLDFCETVIIVDAGSTDGTLEDLKAINDSRINILSFPTSEWEKHKGKEKLNYFTNIAIAEAEILGYEYQFNLQADEILHESSYPYIQKAIETGSEGFLTTRVNLWGSPYMQLNVPASKMPCSTHIVRLTKTNYRSYGDAESIAVDKLNFDFVYDIRMYHMGFVRKRDIMKQKVIHMQEQVFLVEHDKKLDGADQFIPERWFDDSELRPIDEPLPMLIQNWAKERVYLK